MGGYAIVFAVALLTTLAVTPFVRKLAIRIGAIVPPNERGVHTKAMPTLGGAAMFVGFLVAIAVASQIPQFHDMFNGSSAPAGLMLGAGVMFAVGALDDLREVSPPAKLAGMVLAGSLLSLLGVSMVFFRIPFAGQDTLVLSPDLAPLVTVIVVVVFANAINLIDGLDGLAAGIVIIAGTALFLYSDRLFKGGFLDGDNIAPLVAVIAVGICVGFLPYNFNPARIFMGDAGALFLGLLLATTTITIGGHADYQYPGTTYFFYAPLFIPIVILGVPIVDTAFSFVRRAVRGKSFAGRGQGPSAPSPDAIGSRPPPHRRDPLALDRAPLGARSAAHLHELGQPERNGPDRGARARARALRHVRPGPPHRSR